MKALLVGTKGCVKREKIEGTFEALKKRKEEGGSFDVCHLSPGAFACRWHIDLNHAQAIKLRCRDLFNHHRHRGTYPVSVEFQCLL